MSVKSWVRERADIYLDEAEAQQPTERVPLTTNQHILHLLLSVFTAGLWVPVWIIRAVQGNHVPVS